MRLTLLDPHTKLTAELTEDALALAGSAVPVDVILRWTQIEMELAFDWAIREHLTASDNRMKRRPKPWFVTVSEVAEWPVVMCTTNRHILCTAPSADGPSDAHPSGKCYEVIGEEGGLKQVRSAGQLLDLLRLHAAEHGAVRG